MKPVSRRPSKQPTPARRTRKLAPGEPRRDYTKQHNAFAHLITGGKLSGLLQVGIIFWIQRKTWGDEKRPEWARLSYTELCELCNTTDKKTVQRALRDLAKRGIIDVDERKGCSETSGYKLTPDRWKDAPVCEQPEPAAAAPDLAAPDLTADESKVFHDKLTVRPGKRAQVPLQLALQRIEYSTEGLTAMQVVTSATREGVLFVQFCETPEKASKGQKRWGYSPTEQKANTGNNKRLNSFLTCVSNTLLSQFDKVFDPVTDQKFLTDIVAAAGPGLSSSDYQEHCSKLISEFRHKGKRVDSGILLYAAKKARQHFDSLPPLPQLTLRGWEEQFDRYRKSNKPVSNREWAAYLEAMRIERPDRYALQIASDAEGGKC